MWVFDDAAVGLVREPFVGGADTMIEVATAHLPNAERGFVAVFFGQLLSRPPDRAGVGPRRRRRERLPLGREGQGRLALSGVAAVLPAGTGESVRPGEGRG
jgi:hypothetical protein